MHMEDVVALLTPIFPGGVWATNFPQTVAPLLRPAARYTITSVVPFPAACGDGSQDDDVDEDDYTADWQFQLDVIAGDFDTCVGLRKQTRKLLKRTTNPMICTSWQQVFDEETDCHRAILQYTVEASSDS